MTTIKSFTDIEQSKKLAEILPIESADMYYFRQIDNDYFPPDVESICPIPLFKDGKEDFNYDIRCWSLAALLDILPDELGDNHFLTLNKEGKEYCCCYEDCNGNSFKHEFADNPIDACVAMIERLHELNLL